MKQTINFSDFTAAFHRADRGNQFSYDALRVLFDYLENFEEDTGEEIELDVIGLCCEYAESTPAEIAAAYNYDIEGCDDEEALDCVVDALNHEGVYIGDNVETIVYRQF